MLFTPLVFKSVVLSYCIAVASGQSFSVCGSGRFVINSPEDTVQLQNCSLFDGSIIIAPSATGAINLTGVEEIVGNLVSSNATGLVSIHADLLHTIKGNFSLNQLNALSTIRFPKLTNVSKLVWTQLPALKTVQFADVLVGNVLEITVSKTALEWLPGMMFSSVGGIYVNNNPFLNGMIMDQTVTFIGELSVLANGPKLTVNFPKVLSVGSVACSNIASFGFDSLSKISGSLEIDSSQLLDLSVPNLTKVGASLVVNNSSRLNSLSLPALTTIGGSLFITRNKNLKTISGLNGLRVIGGDLTLSGVFDSVELPNLQNVQFETTITTSNGNGTICEQFEDAANSGIIKRPLKCTANSPNKLSKAALVSIVTGSLVACLLLITLMLWCYRFYRKRRSKPISKPKPGTIQLPLGGHHEKAELFASPNQVSELRGDNQYRGQRYVCAASVEGSPGSESRLLPDFAGSGRRQARQVSSNIYELDGESTSSPKSHTSSKVNETSERSGQARYKPDGRMAGILRRKPLSPGNASLFVQTPALSPISPSRYVSPLGKGREMDSPEESGDLFSSPRSTSRLIASPNVI